MNNRSIHKTLLAGVCALGLGLAVAQQQQGVQGQIQIGGASVGVGASSTVGSGGISTSAPPPSEAARYVQACQEALQKGQPGLGCNGALFNNELQRLQGEALQSQHPALLTLVGEAYRNERSPMADIGQAYRWYLMAAVRGDPVAMERLSQMYQKGQGVAPDPVKALGYARLTQQFASPQRHAGDDIARLIQRLGSEMAVEELALSERFAQELAERIQRGAAVPGTPGAAPAASRPPPINIPGLRQGTAVEPGSNP